MDFRCVLYFIFVLHYGLLWHRLQSSIHYALHGLYQQLGAGFFHPVVQLARGFAFANRQFLLGQDVAGINFVLQLKSGYAGFFFTIDDSPVDGRSAAVLGEQRCVKVDPAEPRRDPAARRAGDAAGARSRDGVSVLHAVSLAHDLGECRFRSA